MQIAKATRNSSCGILRLLWNICVWKQQLARTITSASTSTGTTIKTVTSVPVPVPVLVTVSDSSLDVVAVATTAVPVAAVVATRRTTRYGLP